MAPEAHSAATPDSGEAAKRPPAVLVVLCTMLAGLALAWLSNFFDGQETLKRVSARSYAPLLSEAYSASGQKLVTVLSIDDGDLKEYGLVWPLPLEFYGRLIQRLARQQPRAVFLDVVFLDDRPPEQVKSLGDALCAVAAQGVPVFYASYARTDLTSNVELELSTRRDAQGRPCATPVRAHVVRDRLDQHLWNYVLNATPGERIDPLRPRPPRSAALELYCLHDPARCPQDTEEPMALLWPARADDGNPRIMVRATERPDELESICRARWHWSEAVPFNGLARRLWAWLNARDYQRPAPLCPYNKVVPVSAFKGIGFKPEELSEALRGRYVMIGVDVAAVGDDVLSPVHGRLPGVHAHAVALDNLISFDGRYLRGGDVELSWQAGHWLGLNSATGFALFSVSLVAVVMVPVTRGTQRWLGRPRPAAREPSDHRSGSFLRGESLRRRRPTLRALAWLLAAGVLLWLLSLALAHWGGPPRLVWLPPAVLAYAMLVRGQPLFDPRAHHWRVLLQRLLEVLAYALLSALIVVLGVYLFRQGPLAVVEYLGLAALSNLLGWGDKLARNAQMALAALGQPNPLRAWNRQAAARAAQGRSD